MPDPKTIATEGGGAGAAVGDEKAARREAKRRLREMRGLGESLPLYHKEGVMAAETGTVVMFKPGELGRCIGCVYLPLTRSPQLAVALTSDGMIYGRLPEYGGESGEKGSGGVAGVRTHGGGTLVVCISQNNCGRTTRECREFVKLVKKTYK